MNAEREWQVSCADGTVQFDGLDEDDARQRAAAFDSPKASPPMACGPHTVEPVGVHQGRGTEG